eukprot:5435752-Prymnesium_polylepis.2
MLRVHRHYQTCRVRVTLPPGCESKSSSGDVSCSRRCRRLSRIEVLRHVTHRGEPRRAVASRASRGDLRTRTGRTTKENNSHQRSACP